MRSITAFEAKTRFGELLERVAAGEEVVITRHDRPVARIVPAGRSTLTHTRDAVNELNALRLQIAKRTRHRAKLTNADVRAAIDHGRL